MILRKINYIQIIFHFIATWFLMFSFQSFSWLLNIKHLEKIQTYGLKNISANHEKYGITTMDIWYFSFWPSMACLVGIVLAFIISLIISKYKKWSVLNSFIVLILSYVMYQFDVLGWVYFKKIFAFVNYIDDFQLVFIVTGMFLLIIGSIIFFSKLTNQIIQNQYEKQMKQI